MERDNIARVAGHVCQLAAFNLSSTKDRGGLALAAAPASAQTTLKFAVFLPPKSVSVSKVFVPWIKSVEEAAGGELKIQGYWGGSLGRSPKKQYDLVRDGITDLGYLVPGYTPGRFPDFGMFELPYLIRTGEEGSLAQWHMSQKGLLRGFQDVKLIGIFSTEPNLIHTKQPLKSLADVRGTKLRAAGPVYGSVVKHLGAIPIGMRVTQVTESINRGVVHGTLLGWGGTLIFRVHNVPSYHYWAPLGITPLVVVMNKEKWNGLSAKSKAALDKYGGEYIARLGGGAFDAFGKRAHKIITKGGNRTVIKATEAEIKQGFVNSKPVHDRWIAKTEDGAKKYTTLKKVLADIRAGK